MTDRFSSQVCQLTVSISKREYARRQRMKQIIIPELYSQSHIFVRNVRSNSRNAYRPPRNVVPFQIDQH